MYANTPCGSVAKLYELLYYMNYEIKVIVLSVCCRRCRKRPDLEFWAPGPIIVMPHLPQVGGYVGISIVGASPRSGNFVLRPYSITLECDIIIIV